MSDLVDGSTVPWDFVSGPTPQQAKPDPLVQQRVAERRAAAAAPEPIHPYRARRVLVAGRAKARDLATRIKAT